MHITYISASPMKILAIRNSCYYLIVCFMKNNLDFTPRSQNFLFLNFLIFSNIFFQFGINCKALIK